MRHGQVLENFESAERQIQTIQINLDAQRSLKSEVDSAGDADDDYLREMKLNSHTRWSRTRLCPPDAGSSRLERSRRSLNYLMLKATGRSNCHQAAWEGAMRLI